MNKKESKIRKLVELAEKDHKNAKVYFWDFSYAHHMEGSYVLKIEYEENSIVYAGHSLEDLIYKYNKGRKQNEKASEND